MPHMCFSGAKANGMAMVARCPHMNMVSSDRLVINLLPENMDKFRAITRTGRKGFEREDVANVPQALQERGVT